MSCKFSVNGDILGDSRARWTKYSCRLDVEGSNDRFVCGPIRTFYTGWLYTVYTSNFRIYSRI